MLLADYLDTLPPEEASSFAERIGVTRQSLHRYKSGERRPEWDVMERMVVETRGLVTANDFLRNGAEVSDHSGTMPSADAAVTETQPGAVS